MMTVFPGKDYCLNGYKGFTILFFSLWGTMGGTEKRIEMIKNILKIWIQIFPPNKKLPQSSS